MSGVGTRPSASSESASLTLADRAAINPFAALSGLLRRPMASYYLLLASSGAAAGDRAGDGALRVQHRLLVGSGSAYTEFLNQATWAAIGLPAFWLGMRLKVRAFELLAYPLLLVSALMLAGLAIAPEAIGGIEVNHVYLWIKLGPVQVQPAELAKLGLVLWGAVTLLHKRALLGQWKHLAVPLLPVAGVMLLLVGHNDLGSMLLPADRAAHPALGLRGAVPDLRRR